MIDVKSAVHSAMDYISGFESLFPTRNVRLEETELAEGGGQSVWLITLSFVDNPLLTARIYKQFRIDAETGTVLSMKSRPIV